MEIKVTVKKSNSFDNFDDFYDNIFGDTLRKEIENRYRIFQKKCEEMMKEETERLTNEFEIKTKSLEEVNVLYKQHLLVTGIL